MDAATLQKCKESAEEVARAAGKMIREAHQQRASGLKIESKGSTEDAANVSVDLVTATDKACEVAIIDVLKARYPDHLFIGEESSFCGPGQEAPNGPLELTEKPTWIIDP